MIKKTKVLCGLLTLSTVLGHCMTVQAAENINEAVGADTLVAEQSVIAQDKAKKSKQNNKKNEAHKTTAPITIEGDDISFNDKTGEVYAKGKVIIKQNAATIYAEDIQGNTKLNQVKVIDKARITQPGMDVDSYNAFYNYQENTGKMGNAKGIIDYGKHIQAEHMEILPGEYIIYNGSITKCPAKKPDYLMRAKKIEIWPNDKLIAYDAQFLIKDIIIYSTPRYTAKIGDNSENLAFPKLDYDSDYGVAISQNFQVPLSDSVTAEANLGYYTKIGFKNDYQISKQDSNYTLSVRMGDYLDADNHWIKKEPEFEFVYATKRIAGGPWNYNFKAIYGNWKDDYKSSWHQDYTVYFSRDLINLSKSVRLGLGAGYEVVKESYNDSQINTMKYDMVLYKQINSRISAYSGYHYTKNNSQVSLFNYGNTSVGQELASGISYRFDDKNSVLVTQSYDLANNRLADMYYTWNHNLHCWNMSLTFNKDYDGKNDKFSIKVSAAHW